MRKYKVKSVSAYEDWEYCNLLIKRAFFTNSAYNPFEEKDLKMLLISDRIVGAFVLKANKNKALCNFFNIEESLRKEGTGSKFISTIEKYLIFKKFTHIEFHCKEDLINFYKKHGYIAERKENEYYVMNKSIN